MAILTVPPESRAAEAAAVRPSPSLGWAWLQGGLSAARAVAARPEFVVTVFTALHLGASFVNQLVLAYLFGVSIEMDAFLTAGALPLTIVGLVIGELGFVLVPLLSHRRVQEELSEVASRLFSLLAVGGLALGLLGLAGHGWILRLTTSSDIPPATLELALALAPWIWLLVGLNIVCSFFTGLHHFHRRFTCPAVVLAFPYLGMIVGGLGWAPEVGIRSVVYGWLAGTFLKAYILGAGVWRESGLSFRWSFRHRANRELGVSLLPLGVALLPFTVFPVLDAYWASGLPHGSLSTLGYASRIVLALTTLAVQGIAVVLFPAITANGVAGEREQFRQRLSQALQTIVLIILPVAALTAALRVPLLEFLFERGRFDRADTLAVAGVLPWYLLGMLGMAPMNVISRGFFALRDYRTPAGLGLVSLGLYAALCAALTPQLAQVGIAVAYAVTWLLTLFLQAYVLGRAAGKLLDEELLIHVVKVGASALLAAVVAVALSDGLEPRLGLFVGLAVSGLASLLVFAGLSYFVFRVAHLRGLVAAAAKRAGVVG